MNIPTLTPFHFQRLNMFRSRNTVYPNAAVSRCLYGALVNLSRNMYRNRSAAGRTFSRSFVHYTWQQWMNAIKKLELFACSLSGQFPEEISR